MPEEYVETEVEDNDPVHNTVDMLSDGHPWVLVVCDMSEYPALDLKIDAGNGVRDVETIKALLRKALEALPED